MKKFIFPEDFLWGAATSSYQIEGAYNVDGKGESIWDRFSHTSGKIHNNENGDIACDHYHRFQEDVALMKEIGLKSYRFSISWPRILPEGKGKVNQKGLDFYKRLVEELLQNDIQPAVTLYHWDLPQALQDEGGWVNRDTANYFTEYAGIVFQALGDRVPLWITHNEPWVVSFLGYAFGEHAPGIKDYAQALQAAHHLLVSHGMTVDCYRGLNLDGKIGITLNLTKAYPVTDSKKDREAAARMEAFINGWFLDPIFKAEYPQILSTIYEKEFGKSDIKEGDMEIINREIDFLGINYYTRSLVRHNAEDHLLECKTIKNEETEYTEMDWEVYPEGLYDLLVHLNKNYTQKPLYITENGAAYPDKLGEDGRVHDINRINYLREHFKSVHKAIEEGVPLKGYYVWSLMDNFEWAYGYSKRFGIIFVDYEDQQKRVLKDSARWYSQVIRNNGVLE